MRGICVNHDCKRFEYVVEADSDDARCDECGQLLCHESGLTWGDARKKGYESAFEVGRPGEVGGAPHLLPDSRSRKGSRGRKRKS